MIDLTKLDALKAVANEARTVYNAAESKVDWELKRMWKELTNNEAGLSDDEYNADEEELMDIIHDFGYDTSREVDFSGNTLKFWTPSTC